jgi:hypothetical protein
LNREDTIYRLHRAEYQGASITVIPRDRDLSNAQESGLNPAWFAGQVTNRTADATKPCLVTTWSDGENGGWFRQIHEEAGFWGYFFAPYMDEVRAGQMPVRLTSVEQFAQFNPPSTLADVRTGAWNVGSTSGYDFAQWAGSGSQKQALDQIYRLRRRYEETNKRAAGHPQIAQAYEAILRAETSCYLFWGDAWIPSCTPKPSWPTTCSTRWPEQSIHCPLWNSILGISFATSTSCPRCMIRRANAPSASRSTTSTTTAAP